MKLAHKGVYSVYEQVAMDALLDDKKNVYFELLDGYHQSKDSREEIEPAFTAYSDGGPAGCHRAHFLDGIVKLLPKDIASFGKELVSLEEATRGKMKMTFKDGSCAVTDAVVGCDGVKSRIRKILVGKTHPSASPQYSHKYGYRLLIPMEDAISAVGPERAKTGTIYVREAVLRGCSHPNVCVC